MDKDRQIYQLHKNGYEKIANAITNMDLKIEIEVTNATVTSADLTEEPDEEENS